MPDREAGYTDFVRDRRPKLIRTAYLLCGDWAHAEDIVQIVLVKAYLAWPRIRADRADAYVRRMIVHTSVDEWRRPSGRAVLAGDSLIDLVPTTPGGVGYEERVTLLDAVGQLPTQQRQVVVLRHWWGCSVAEVARDLRISEGTVKSHTARALDRLKSLLAEPDESAGPGSTRTNQKGDS